MSVGPPGGKGMTSLIGRDGYLSWEGRRMPPLPSRQVRSRPSVVCACPWLSCRSHSSLPVGSAPGQQGHEKRRALLPAVSSHFALRPDVDREARRVVVDHRRGDVAVIIRRRVDHRRLGDSGSRVVAVVVVPAVVLVPLAVAPPGGAGGSGDEGRPAVPSTRLAASPIRFLLVMIDLLTLACRLRRTVLLEHHVGVLLLVGRHRIVERLEGESGASARRDGPR